MKLQKVQITVFLLKNRIATVSYRHYNYLSSVSVVQSTGLFAESQSFKEEGQH